MNQALERLKRLPDGMLACPDTHLSITFQDEQLICPKTGKVFASIDGLPALFPEGWTFTKEILDEDKFYSEEQIHAEFTPSHQMAHLNARLPIKRWCELIGMKRDSWVLNVGAGAGSLDLEMLRKHTENILAIDVSPSAVGIFVKQQPFPCLLATASQLPLQTDSMDAVVMSGVLHHVAGYERMAPYLIEALRVLKPGGAFISVDPNLLYPVAIVMAALDVVGQRIHPGWRHHVPHERPLIPVALQRNVRRAGFAGVELLGTSYVHNKLPWSIARLLHMMTTDLAKKPGFRHFGYWIGCAAYKPRATNT